MKKILICLVVFVIAGWAVSRLLVRYRFEQKNNKIELCIEFNQIERICNKENYQLNEFFKRIRKTDVTSIVLEEETVASLEKLGKITYLSASEINKFRTLNILPEQLATHPESIIVGEGDFADYLAAVIEKKTGCVIKPDILQNDRQWTILDVRRIPDINSMYLGYLPDKVRKIKQNGFKTIYKLSEQALVPKDLPENFSCFLIDREVNENVTRELILQNKRVTLVEFSPGIESFQKKFRRMSDKILRAHRIELSKRNLFLVKHEINTILSRWNRAVRERNCRVLYFDFIDNISLEENLNYLGLLCKKLKESGFVFDTPLEVPGQVSGGLPDSLSKSIAFLIAVGFPVFSLSYVLKKGKKNPIMRFIYICLINLAGGFLISSLLSDYVFLVKLDEFRGIKPSFILPFILAVPFLYSFEEIKIFLNSNVKIASIVLSVFLLAGIVFMFARSGNYMQITGLETQFRFSLEEMLGVRPRFKEFLIGHPIMLLGLWSNNRILILMGLAGQISIINSFIHAHTPLTVTFLRTFYGFGIGLIITLSAGLSNLLLIYCFTLVRKTWLKK
ncbi:MAG: hypothetical protein AUJ85_06485 [Elusimicrobia bacterium CG1_02_37_114]|nr:MAG: hypothetical protein AUJ85_06485 [Elusimicrobia bacterium CG1_02_37_114]